MLQVLHIIYVSFVLINLFNTISSSKVFSIYVQKTASALFSSVKNISTDKKFKTIALLKESKCLEAYRVYSDE